jgi:hypothetical protein
MAPRGDIELHEEERKVRCRRRGHRLGLFLLVLSTALMLTGALSMGDYTGEYRWAQVTGAMGFLGVIFAYPLSRLVLV